jgi:hypothetical protein
MYMENALGSSSTPKVSERRRIDGPRFKNPTVETLMSGGYAFRGLMNYPELPIYPNMSM